MLKENLEYKKVNNMTWKDEIKKSEKIDFSFLEREKGHAKKEFTRTLRDWADAIDNGYKDKLFEHESSKEAITMVMRGLRLIRTKNRLFYATLEREKTEGE
jgi:hypothetical protein